MSNAKILTYSQTTKFYSLKIIKRTDPVIPLAARLKDVQYDTAIVLSHDFSQQAADLYLIVFFIIVVMFLKGLI